MPQPTVDSPSSSIIPFATVTVVLDSKFAIETVVERLIRNSQWFAVKPLPGDKWEITTKPGVDLSK
jgi:hypothetical protein